MIRTILASLAAFCATAGAALAQPCAELDLRDVAASANASPSFLTRGVAIVSVVGARDVRVLNITEQSEHTDISCNAYVSLSHPDGSVSTQRMSIARTMQNGAAAYSLAPVM